MADKIGQHLKRSHPGLTGDDLLKLLRAKLRINAGGKK
jgi:hypothetical protein